MNVMNDVLSDCLDDFVLVFLDYILVYSYTVEIHVEHLGKVLEALPQHCLFARCQNVASWSKRSSSLDSAFPHKALLL